MGKKTKRRRKGRGARSDEKQSERDEGFGGQGPKTRGVSLPSSFRDFLRAGHRGLRTHGTEVVVVSFKGISEKRKTEQTGQNLRVGAKKTINFSKGFYEGKGRNRGHRGTRFLLLLPLQGLSFAEKREDKRALSNEWGRFRQCY